MRKLRSIKDRTENVEVENDLRGLGETDILLDSSPQVILSVRNINKDVLVPIAEDFGVFFEELNNKFVFVLEGQSLKEYTLKLFILSLIVNQHNGQSELYIKNKLKEKITKQECDFVHESNEGIVFGQKILHLLDGIVDLSSCEEKDGVCVLNSEQANKLCQTLVANEISDLNKTQKAG